MIQCEKHARLPAPLEGNASVEIGVPGKRFVSKTSQRTRAYLIHAWIDALGALILPTQPE
jgi:hypothetical protein